VNWITTVAEQKYICMRKKNVSGMWLLAESGGTSYLASQCEGESGLEKDLAHGWIVKAFWEDRTRIVFLLERMN
jgi:hypothetical protein